MTDRTDSFDRADSNTTIGTPSDAGSAWLVGGGTWGIASNLGYKVASDTTGFQSVSLQADVSNVEVQVTLVVGSQAGGPTARVSGNNWLMALWGAAGSTLICYKNVAGSLTQIGSTYSATLSAGQVTKIRCDSADAISVYVDGTLRVGPVTETAGSTNTRAGLYAYDIAQRFEDFSITEIVVSDTLMGQATY